MDEEKYLTLEEAGAKLRKKPDTVRKWVHKGILRGKRVGGRILIRETEVLDFLDNAPAMFLPTMENTDETTLCGG